MATTNTIDPKGLEGTPATLQTFIDEEPKQMPFTGLVKVDVKEEDDAKPVKSSL